MLCSASASPVSGVHEDIEIAPVCLEPSDDPFELVVVEAELTAPTGVWPHRSGVKSSQAHMARLPSTKAELARLSLRGLVEVDMRMIAVVEIFGSLRHER